MEQQKISVIVPVYKVEAYLDRCVLSIANQSYKNLEIILVDDGSPDNCPALCDAWSERDSRIKVVHKQNGGLSDARNAGMAIATGEFMGFVDSDDWIAPDMYQHLYDLLETDGSDIAACGVEMVWEDGTPSRMLTKAGCCVLNQEDAMLAIIEESWLKQPVWYKLYKTALIRDIPFPVGKYHEDVFWSYQAVARAQRVSVSDKIGYYYFQRSGSIMGESYSLKRLDAVEAKALRMAFIHEQFPILETLAQIDLLFTCMYHGQMAIKYLGTSERKQAFTMLEEMVKLCPVPQGNEYRMKSVKHKIWVRLAKWNLALACRIRGTLGIGL